MLGDPLGDPALQMRDQIEEISGKRSSSPRSSQLASKGQQRPRRRRLDDQPLTLLAHHRGAAGKLEFAGNARNSLT
jgi:hypothetical protein